MHFEYNAYFLRAASVLDTLINLLRAGRVMVVDVSRLVVKSELQPPEPALEDATCMELEERLYDRFHAECILQVCGVEEVCDLESQNS